MNDFKELLKELEQHREQMFSTIGRTISDAARLFDTACYNSLQDICSIYDKKYKDFQKEQTGLGKDEFFNWIEKKYLQNYEDDNFSFSWLESYDQLKNCLYPLSDDNAYKDFLLSTEYTGQRRLEFNEQIFFLAGAFRFYRELGTTPPPNISINTDIPTILRIDRKVSFIREEIYSAIATRKKAAEQAKGTTATNVSKELGNSEPFKVKNEKYRDVFVQTVKELKMKNRPISFNKFVENAAPKVSLSKTGLFKHFKAIGINRTNFDEWLEELLT